MDKLWAGRISVPTDSLADSFNSSLMIDKRMYAQDIKGSMAHAAMLGAKGVIPLDDADKIIAALSDILEDLESGKLDFSEGGEDIHMFIEAQLTKRIGDAGKKLHTARSRNDQVALDFRLYLRDEIKEIISLILELMNELANTANNHITTVMPGYTHMQRAQPVTFGHHLLAYAMMFSRDVSRLKDAGNRMNVSPLGSCALAGTTYEIDRDMTAEALGFSSAALNSIDGVSDRDFAVEICSALSILMMHLSRFSEEIILWSSWEFKFIELSDSYSTGSSIMPQKKNPDMAELVRGKTGRVYGDLISLLTMLKGLPLAYNKDMQEDKEAVFDSIDTAKICLSIFTPMIKTMTVLTDNMRAAAARGFINATDCADYLTKKGLPFRNAYKITGEIVAYCIKNGETLETLPVDIYKGFSDQFESDLYQEISLETCVEKRISKGGTCEASVREQIQYVTDFISANK